MDEVVRIVGTRIRLFVRASANTLRLCWRPFSLSLFAKAQMIFIMDWHRLFGLVLTDFFTGSPYVVELEKDLSLKQQFLDVVVVRKQSGDFAGRLPDGLDNLADHNLISFKSYQESFDAWTMKELIGHYVNYRKQVSPSPDQMLPEENFRLFGICARQPIQLGAQIELQQLQPGVYECAWGTDRVRLVVLRDLPREEHNAPLHLFSAVQAQVKYGQENFSRRCPETSSLLRQLLARYQQEGIPMPYTMEDYRRDLRKEVLEGLSPVERLEGLSPVERLEGLSPEERLEGLSTQEFLHSLPPQKRAELLKAQLEGLSAEELEKFLLDRRE